MIQSTSFIKLLHLLKKKEKKEEEDNVSLKDLRLRSARSLASWVRSLARLG